MSDDVMCLTIALYEEHRQRTGHDCRKVGIFDLPGRAPLITIECTICMYLNRLLNQAEAATTEGVRRGE